MAHKIGVAEKTYAFYEKSRKPKEERLEQIAKAIGVDYSDLAVAAAPVDSEVERSRREILAEIARLRRDLGLDQ